MAVGIQKNMVQTFGSRIFFLVISFVSSIILTRMLGPEGKGITGFLHANAFLMATVFGLNTPSFLLYFIAKKNASQQSFRFAAILMAIVTPLVLAVLFILYYSNSVFLDFLLPQNHGQFFFFFYLVTSFVVTLILNFIVAYLRSRLQFKIYNNLTILIALAELFIFSYFYFFKNLSNQSLDELIFILSFGIGIKIVGLLLFAGFFFKDFIKFRQTASIAEVGETKTTYINYLKTGYLIFILHYLTMRIDMWFIEEYYPIEQLGFYSLAAILAEILISIMRPLILVVRSYVTKSSKKIGLEILGIFSRVSNFVAFFGIVLAALTAHIFIPLFYGNAFSETIAPFQVLCFASLFLIARLHLNGYNFATNNLRPNLIANAFALAVTLVLNIILVPSQGIMGAAISSLCAYFVSFAILYFSFTKRENLSFSHLFIPTKKDWARVKDILLKPSSPPKK